MDTIISLVEKESETMNVRTGYRAFANVERIEAMEPMLQLIIDEARKKVSFPLKNETRIQEILVSVAPEVNSRSNWWTKGLVHRDMDSVDNTGVYSFMLCLDEVTGDNGALAIWPETKKTKQDKKHPKRAMKGMVTTTMKGPKNSVFTWDSRLLHEPMPNRSRDARRILVWIVTSKSKPGVDTYN